MHFFILCAGLLLGWQPGLAAGILSPVISFSMSGMPPLPMLLPLTLEMATFGLVAGLMRKVFHRNSWLSVGVAMICGRIVVAAAVSILGIKGPLAYLTGAVYAGLPGIAIQLALLPLIVRMLNRRTPL
jgi:niacin transporter